MYKADLIQAIANKSGLSKRRSENFINLMFDYLASILVSGKRIEIRGFGSFAVREYNAYEGMNPKTGDKVHIEAKRLPFFKAGKDLNRKINS